MYGSPGVGTPLTCSWNQLKAATSLSIDTCRFKVERDGAGLLGEQVGVGMESATALMPLIESARCERWR